MAELVRQGKQRVLLRNVVEFYKLVVAVRDRPVEIAHNIGVMYGWSGVGKSEASIYAQNKTRGIRVEIDEHWTAKTLLEEILREAQIEPPKRATANELFKMAIATLSEDPKRPLFIDEADLAIDKGYGETIRALAMKSGVPIILIGEERLPAKLATIERLDNRVVEWFGALRCDASDARLLADMLLPRLPIADSVLADINKAADGRARRIVTVLVKLRQWSLESGATKIEDGFRVDTIYSGERPKARLATASKGGRAA